MTAVTMPSFEALMACTHDSFRRCSRVILRHRAYVPHPQHHRRGVALPAETCDNIIACALAGLFAAREHRAADLRPRQLRRRHVTNVVRTHLSDIRID